MSDDEYRLADRAGDEPAQVLRRTFVAAVALVFILGLPLGTAATAIGTILVVLALAVELLLPRDRLIGRWQGLAAGRAAGADSGYGALYRALRARDVPAEVRPHRLRTPAGVRNGLTVRAGAERVQVVVLASGRDLAFGWTMWHREIPALAVWHWLQAALGRHEPVDDTPARALAAAVHAAALEGLAAAESEREVSLVEAFGREVPVMDHGTRAPAAAGSGGQTARGNRAAPGDQVGPGDQVASGAPGGPSATGAPGSRVHGSALARLRGAAGRLQNQAARSGGRHAGERAAARAGRSAVPPMGSPVAPHVGPPAGRSAVPPMGPPAGPPAGWPGGPPAEETLRVPPLPGQPDPGAPPGEPADRRPPLVPGLGDMEERTAVISPLQFRPYEFTVAQPVEVYTPDGAVVGRLEPRTRYWAVDEHPGGLVVQIAAGAALLRDRAAIRPE